MSTLLDHKKMWNSTSQKRCSNDVLTVKTKSIKRSSGISTFQTNYLSSYLKSCKRLCVCARINNKFFHTKKKYPVSLAPEHRVSHKWKCETCFINIHSQKKEKWNNHWPKPKRDCVWNPKVSLSKGMVCQQGVTLITQLLTWDVKLSTASASHLSKRRLGVAKGEGVSNLCLFAPPHLSPPAQSA